MLKTTLIPYKGYSEAAKRLHSLNPSWGYNTKEGDIFVNFGSTTKKRTGTIYINHPSKVKTSINKHTCFLALKDKANIPRFTTDIEEAKTFSSKVYCRHLLESSQGHGITVAEPTNLPPAKLYVEAIQVKREYRVIAIKDKIVTTMMKVPRHENNPNTDIRNLHNGWRFSINTVYPNEQAKVQTEAIKAIKALGLQFGAIDISLSTNYIPYVLEVNTAFALGPNNVQLFSEALNNYINQFKELL